MGDVGRTVYLKMSDPNSEYVPAPGVFLPWRIPEDPNIEECSGGGGGGGSTGGAVYRRNICSCNNSDVELDTPYDIEPGNMIGPTNQGISDLIDQDPDAYWDPMTESVISPDFPGLTSPRIVKLALFQPGEIQGSGLQSIRFNNFALMFLEEQGSNRDPVTARFIKYAGGSGEGSGETTSSLTLFLRLVE